MQSRVQCPAGAWLYCGMSRYRHQQNLAGKLPVLHSRCENWRQGPFSRASESRASKTFHQVTDFFDYHNQQGSTDVPETEETISELGVFAKFWEPGKVKTRLAASIGEVEAANLFRQFLETTLERLAGLADRCTLCFSPLERKEEFEAFCPAGWQLRPQVDGNLGERMQRFFTDAYERGASRVILLGSDTPNVPKHCITQAFDFLERSDIVLGPSGDGGYYLVGGKDSPPPVFENISWSTPNVWQQTVDHLNSLGMRHRKGYETVLAWNDIDTHEDLLNMRDQLLRQRQHENDPALEQLFDAVEKVLLFSSGGGQWSVAPE